MDELAKLVGEIQGISAVGAVVSALTILLGGFFWPDTWSQRKKLVENVLIAFVIILVAAEIPQFVAGIYQ
jgi:hypothetical protein